MTDFSRVLPATLVALLLAGAASAQEAEQPVRSAPPPPVPAPSPEVVSILLYEELVAENSEQWETFFNQLIVRNVNVPSIYPVLPEAARRNGNAVLVLPGGGYQFVSMQNEGFPVAERLADAGYTAFVLKYRTRETGRAPTEFLEDAGKAFSGLGTGRLQGFRPAVDDLFAAVDLVRKQCSQMECDGGSLSIVGFSAGARTVIRALEDAEHDLAVAAVALIYPPMLDPVAVKPTVPLFLAVAQDDPLFKQGGFTLADSWVRMGGSMEFHLYNSGGHGFGTASTGKTSQNWLDAYVAWLDEQNSQDTGSSSR